MRSPDSRLAAERALRAIAILVMAVLAVRLWHGGDRSSGETRVRGTSLDSALVAWSVDAPESATLDAMGPPAARQRDWLVALRRAGLGLSWTIADTTGGALVVEAAARPASPARVTALGSRSAPVTLGDALGRIDSATTGPDRAATWRLSAVGPVHASIGDATAIAAPRDSLVSRPVLLIGSAGWEAKFVTAALEEDGWTVATRITIAPSAVVRQGAQVSIDTGAFSAVVLLDSTSRVDAGAMARFVNAGGGLVAAGSAVNHPALRALVPRVSGASPAAVGGLAGPMPRDGLSARHFRVSANAVPVETRRDDPVILGRRVGAGRVLAVGYEDTWRLRMAAPAETAPGIHRDWWSSLVGSVALVRMVPRQHPGIDEAPLAASVTALGPPIQRDGDAGGGSLPWNAIAASLAAIALLAEWLSRRVRGLA